MAVAAISLAGLLSSCGPARPAFFQPQPHPYPHPVAASPNPQTDAATTPANPPAPHPAAPLATTSQPVLVAEPVQTVVRSYPPKQEVVPHLNPDSYPVQHLTKRTEPSVTEHVAPQSHLIDRHSPNRKTHKLALLALGLAVLSYGSLFFTGGSTLLWVLSIFLPLGATLLGTASLMTINRQKERYRGKGWAMAAIVVGTGALGLALMAVAALSVSRMVWER